MIEFKKSFTAYPYPGMEIDATVGCSKEGGWYEVYDVETGGEEYYAEGCLEIEDVNGEPTLIGYDGCFELLECVTTALEEQGVTLDI